MAMSMGGTGPGGSSAERLSVVIIASGHVRGGGLVHAVAVTQPVQSWTVFRSHDDFQMMGGALSQILHGVAPCPQSIGAGADINAIAAARNQMQEWLTETIARPGAPENPAVRNFLTVNANMIPPQFGGVSWVNFTISGGNPPPQMHPQQALNAIPAPGDVGDMDLEELLYYGDDQGSPAQEAESDDEYEPILPAKQYKPTNEALSYEDIDILQDEVTMVEDVGSLAQSLGASHLGRSLQLQAQMGHHTRITHPATSSEVQGVTVGGVSSSTTHLGGIGSAMENAGGNQRSEANGEGLHRTAPISAPRLDSFNLIRVIGKGSFGKVILVKEKQTGEMFALKVLKKANVVRRNQVEHTRTERSVLGYVNHPFIVGMKMAFQSRDKLYFVLDYCAGGELFFHLGRLGRFPEHQACFYAAEITLAISYVHSLGIIYRDLKPENVLLDARGHIRLTDFGLSKEGINSSSSGANSFCGTPEYLAPEILNRLGHGRAVDWWSLGALLYEMLTGLPPFYCQDRDRLFNKIRNEQLQYPASLSVNARELLRGLLTKDPEHRLGSGENDADDIKPKAFFIRIDWDRLTRGELDAPWRPEINGNLDTSQFDREFTDMPVYSPQSMQRSHGFAGSMNDNLFENFTYQDRILRGPGAATRM